MKASKASNEVLKLARKPHVRAEKDEERLADDFMARHGYEAVRFSQPRHTMQTEGISDRLYVHRGWRHAVWWEAKREGGKQRPSQRWFQGLVEAAGDEYVCGPFEALEAHMRTRLPELRVRRAA